MTEIPEGEWINVKSVEDLKIMLSKIGNDVKVNTNIRYLEITETDFIKNTVKKFKVLQFKE